MSEFQEQTASILSKSDYLVMIKSTGYSIMGSYSCKDGWFRYAKIYIVLKWGD